MYLIKDTTVGYVTCDSSRTRLAITALNPPCPSLSPPEHTAGRCCPLLGVLWTHSQLLSWCWTESHQWRWALSFWPVQGCWSGCGCRCDACGACSCVDWGCGTSSSWGQRCCHPLSWSRSCLKNCGQDLKWEAGSEDRWKKRIRVEWRRQAKCQWRLNEDTDIEKNSSESIQMWITSKLKCTSLI